MKRFLLIVMMLPIIGSLKLVAQNMGNYQYNNPQNVQSKGRGAESNALIQNNSEITITVNGLMNVVANNYVAVFNSIQIGETMDSTNLMMNNRISEFKRELKKIGIEDVDVKIDMVSFVPRYEYQEENKLFSKTFNELPAGFEMQKNISVHYTNATKLDEIITAASNVEIYDLIKVDYFPNNIQKDIDSLRMECLQELKSREEASLK